MHSLNQVQLVVVFVNDEYYCTTVLGRPALSPWPLCFYRTKLSWSHKLTQFTCRSQSTLTMMTLSFLVLCTITSVHANSDSVPGMCLQCRAILVSSYSVRLVVCLAVCERQLGKDMLVRVLSMHCFGLHACILCMDACSGGLHTHLSWDYCSMLVRGYCVMQTLTILSPHNILSILTTRDLNWRQQAYALAAHSRLI